MCGIVGVVAGDGETVGLTPTELQAMRDTMEARGPDGAGEFFRQNVALGHRRLAIRDIEQGQQPWISPDESCALVYNGEIYNDRELRRTLTARGHLFRTRCDTETVMNAYRYWGNDCVHQLRGMFAFGIYDFRKRSLLLARDRFGVKPLFFAEVNGRFVFASSIAAILRHPGFKATPDWIAVSHYLSTMRMTLGRRTMYQGIWQLLPGEVLRLKEGRVAIDRYWTLDEKREDDCQFDEAVTTLRQELVDAVERRMTSDVEVGMFLSGGVDSCTLAHFMKEETGRSFRSGCISSAEDQQGDASHASQYAKAIDLNHESVGLSSDEYRHTWQDFIAETALPTATPSDVMIYRLSQEMKKSVGVVLGGEGADELMCGYAVQHWAGNDYDLLSAIEQGCWIHGAGSRRLFEMSLKTGYGREKFQSPIDFYFAINSFIPLPVKNVLLRPEIIEEAEADRQMWDFYTHEFNKSGQNGQTTSERLTRMLHRINLETLVERLDRATMQASLEARVPFTDHVLVEKIAAVPFEHKIGIAETEKQPYLAAPELHQRGSIETKKILRTVAHDVMPSELVKRPKASFPAPIQNWMAGDWKEWSKERLTTSPFLNEVCHAESLRQLAENPETTGVIAWPLLNLAEWGDRQFAA